MELGKSKRKPEWSYKMGQKVILKTKKENKKSGCGDTRYTETRMALKPTIGINIQDSNQN